MKIYSIFLLLLIASCKKDHTEKKESVTKERTCIQDSLNTEEKTLIQGSLNIEKNMLLTKEEAIKNFGKPTQQETMLIDELYGEFRVGIYYLYTEEERQSRSIYVEECTWEKDNENNITIWYELSNNKRIPKTYLIWDKGFEF